MKRLATSILALTILTTPVSALINDKGQLIDSPKNLAIAQCEKLAKQAVRVGYRKVLYPSLRLTKAELKAECNLSDLHYTLWEPLEK